MTPEAFAYYVIHEAELRAMVRGALDYFLKIRWIRYCLLSDNRYNGRHGSEVAGD